jgi:hypothetical protein
MKECLKIRRRRYGQGKREKGKARKRLQASATLAFVSNTCNIAQASLQNVFQASMRNMVVTSRPQRTWWLLFLLQYLLLATTFPAQDMHAPSLNIDFANLGHKESFFGNWGRNIPKVYKKNLQIKSYGGKGEKKDAPCRAVLKDPPKRSTKQSQKNYVEKFKSAPKSISVRTVSERCEIAKTAP